MAVQPAALRWFRQPVVEIKQISAYSCRGMNGNPNAHISEHAFGNALDVAEFALADGHKISVQYGWHGTPEEQGFLHDVQLAACQEFTTVLAPGANVYHYNHIHVDLMRHASGRHICQPAAIPGEVVAERCARVMPPSILTIRASPDRSKAGPIRVHSAIQTTTACRSPFLAKIKFSLIVFAAKKTQANRPACDFGHRTACRSGYIQNIEIVSQENNNA